MFFFYFLVDQKLKYDEHTWRNTVAVLQHFSLEIYFYLKPTLCEIHFGRIEMFNHSPALQKMHAALGKKIMLLKKKAIFFSLLRQLKKTTTLCFLLFLLWAGDVR